MKGEKGRRKKEKFVVPNAQACAEAIGIMWKKKGKGERQLILKHKEVYVIIIYYTIITIISKRSIMKNEERNTKLLIIKTEGMKKERQES